MKRVTGFISVFVIGCLCCMAQSRLPFAKGADISWITQIEHTAKYQLVNEQGQPIDGFQMMRDCGMNMVRLRVWVHPKPEIGRAHV